MKKAAKFFGIFLSLTVALTFSSCRKKAPYNSDYSSCFVFGGNSDSSEEISESEKPKSEITEKASEKSSQTPAPSSGGAVIDTVIKDKEIKRVPYSGIRIKSDRLTVFSSLGTERQEIYKKLLAATEEFTTGWIDLGKLDGDFKSDISAAFQALCDDYPEMFWLPSAYLLSHTETGEIAVMFEGKSESYTLSYLASKTEAQSMKVRLEEVVNSVTAATKSLSSQFEAELYIHDFICNNTAYNINGKYIYSAYGALVDKNAVCEGYSRAFALLCSKAGINSFLVRGVSKGQNHMWNTVSIDNAWYNIDVTWDDQNIQGNPTYSYFNLTDAELNSDHSPASYISPKSGKADESGLFNLTKNSCTASEMNYFVHEKLILNSESEIGELSSYIKWQLDFGRHFAQIKVTNQRLLADASALRGKIADAMQRNSSMALTGMNLLQNTNYIIVYF